MSVKVMSACWERYPNGGGELLLALALADHADDNGENVYPSVESLSRKTRQSKRTVQYQLRSMQDRGWLQLVSHEGGGRGRSREYRINPDWIKGAEIAPFSDTETMQNLHPLEEKRVQILRPLANKRVQSEAERVQSTTLKGATAVAPESSGTIKESSLIYRGFDFSGWPTLPPAELIDDWIRIRNKLQAPPTQTAIHRMGEKLTQCYEAGFSVELCLSEVILGNWKGLELEWLQNKKIQPDRPDMEKPAPQEKQKAVLTELQEAHAQIQSLERLQQPVPDSLVARQNGLRQQLNALRGEKP